MTLGGRRMSSKRSRPVGAAARLDRAAGAAAHADGGAVLQAGAARSGAACGGSVCGQQARRGRPELDVSVRRSRLRISRATARGSSRWPRATIRCFTPSSISKTGKAVGVATFMRIDRRQRRDRGRQHQLLAAAAADAGRDRGHVPDDARACSTSSATGATSGSATA